MAGKVPKKLDRPGVDRYGRTELHYAALEGKMEELIAQIEAGKDVNQQDDNGMTPLHFAAQERRVSVVAALLEKGANPNLVDRHGNSPLWTAIMNARGDFEMVRLLLAAGADPDHKNNHEKSPRDIALRIKGRLEDLFIS